MFFGSSRSHLRGLPPRLGFSHRDSGAGNLRKSRSVFAVIFGREHAGDDRYFGTRRHTLAHQFAGEATVQVRLDADDARTVAFRSIRGNTNDAYSFFLCFIDQWRQILRTSGGEDDSIDAVLTSSLKTSMSPSPSVCTGRLSNSTPSCSR